MGARFPAWKTLGRSTVKAEHATIKTIEMLDGGTKLACLPFVHLNVRMRKAACNAENDGNGTGTFDANQPYKSLPFLLISFL